MSNYKSWPFLEALKLKRNLEKNNCLSIKKIINFETGYGPSGVPHQEASLFGRCKEDNSREV